MENLNTRRFLIPLILFLIALSVRVAYLVEMPNIPFFDAIPQSLDHFNFDRSAISFSQGDWLARAPNNSFAPLYKYFLGVIYFIFGRNFHAIYLVQFVMGAFSCVLVYWIGKNIFSHRAGLLASLGLAFYSTQIIYEGILLRAAFISFWGLCSFFLLHRLQREFSKAGLVLATLALSMFFQARPNTILCLPLICFFLHLKVFSSMAGPDKGRSWSLFAGVLLLSFVPLLVQCYLVHGRFVFFDLSGPHTFISGNLIPYSGVGFEHQLVEDYQKKNALSFSAVVPYLLRQIADDPLGFINLYLRKIYFFLNDFEAPSNISVYLYRDLSNILPWLWSHYALYSALGLVGIVLAVKNRKQAFLLHSYTLSLSLAILLFLNEARYRIPVVPYFILFSGYALDTIYSGFIRKNYRTAVITLAVSLILLLGLREPPGMQRIRANDYGNLGTAYMMRGEVDKAAAAFKTSLDMEPNNVFAHINVGRIYADANKFPEAVEEFLTAIRLNPGLWEAYYNLGVLYLNSRHFELAEKSLLKARELATTPPQVSYKLGVLYQNMERHSHALEYFNVAKKLDPRNPAISFQLGVEYGELKRYQEAARAFEEAIALRPDYDEAFNNLGVMYQFLDRPADSIRAFKEALRINPEFSDARSNLERLRKLFPQEG